MKKLTAEATQIKDDFYRDIPQDVEDEMIIIAFALSAIGIKRGEVSSAALRALADLDDKIQALPNKGLMDVPDEAVGSDLATMKPVGGVN